ncbi:hypothetical protein DL769_001595 [Monosporascus sp. CRB-8-3]|nr:hypothetical protein DL769_001595 [Monosporascus sp. CRB-8-3]
MTGSSPPDEPNWGIAHRILMPAFGPVSIRNMFDDMHDIATQLCMKWARYGPHHPIAVADDFTRLALDTIALCSMGYRFNSYYTTGMHPFIEAMGEFLLESGRRPSRPPIPSWFYRNQDSKYFEDIKVMQETAQGVLKARKEANERGENGRKDLLQAMLEGVDPKTGQHMTDESIIDNLITFLIAGHETTSGMLSFAFYQLLKHPEAYRKAQEEVDSVVGKKKITVEHITKLPYIAAILREVLRVNAPISMFGVRSREDTLLAEKYPVPKDTTCFLFLAKSHLDPKIYGQNANDFVPERMLDENFNRLPKNSWKPFGNGSRACIGRPFAWQEAILIMAMLLQNFNFVLDDPNYNLRLKQTLTIKPHNFQMRAILRDGLTATQLERRLAGEDAPKEAQKSASAAGVSADGSLKKITILYGSNSGTCESLAQRLASDAPNHGFVAETVDCLDVANGKLPRDQPVIILTASYEGQPPDNAGHFVSWLENIKDDTTLSGVQYAVFGCGHHDWAQTFFRIPKLVDAKLEQAGAERLVQIGLADAADSDMFSNFENWEYETLWPALKKQYDIGDNKGSTQSGTVDAVVTSPRTNGVRQDVREALVGETRVLTAEGEPAKKHIELELPSDITYTAGDYLAVLPFNPKESIGRAMRRFRLPWDAYITVKTDSKLSVPTNTPISANEVFSAYVELSQPATKRNILTLAEAAEDSTERDALKALATSEEGSRASVLDLLEKYPSIELPLGSFIAMLPPMRVRQYSVSSSPLWDPTRVTLTFSVLNAPSTTGSGKHLGVASNYLNSLDRGDKVHVSVRSSHAAFHLPREPESVPIVCVAAGTGLAPFRGFIQERATMCAAGRKLAPALLFFGCREPGRDDLYADELAEWEAAGAVTVVRAYSRRPELSGGARHVQDAIALHEREFQDLWARGAKLYICGSRAVGRGVRDVCVRMRVEKERRSGREVSREEAEKWWEGLRNTRYATDVFD